MSKLQLLNEYLTERLMETVRDILEVVGATVMEYREETARTHRENELLRRRLREAGVREPEAVRSAVPPVPGAGSPATRDFAGLDWNALPGRDAEATPVDGKQELHEGVIHLGVTTRRDSCELLESGWTAGRGKATSGGPGLGPACRKNDRPQDAVELSDLFKVKIISPSAEVNSRPDAESGPIKMEPNGMNFGSTDESGNLRGAEEPNGSETAGECMTWSETQPSRGRPRQVRATRSHSCPQCGKTFGHVSRLKIHLRIHTGEKPYSCAQCGKCFNNDGTLKNHQRVHTEVRLFSCSQCGMSFKDAYTCKKHQRVHNISSERTPKTHLLCKTFY